MKKVSFIIGAYNSSKRLDKVLDSILAQTYTNFEVVICDDFSIDKTWDVLKKYKEKYPNIFKILRNEKSLSHGGTLNRCLENATGDYIARMDDDDICYPYRLAKQVEFLEMHKDIDCVGSYMDIFDGEKVISQRKAILNPSLDTLLKGGYPFHHPTIMIRANVIRALNGYQNTKETLRCEDLDLWYRFFIAGYKGANLDIPLLRYNESVEDYNKRKISNLSTAVKLRKYYRKKLKANPLYDLIYLKTLVMALFPNKFRHYVKTKFKY
ncbi:MAG: glycosyltransferase family 2 protein [Erysipelotrichaceae bacterium]|jgi:glycosyltransferase EpsE